MRGEEGRGRGGKEGKGGEEEAARGEGEAEGHIFVFNIFLHCFQIVIKSPKDKRKKTKRTVGRWGNHSLSINL